ncbi:MAG: sugar ABC transporter permease [Spirochaetales bacterium]|nr:sugar ABC transporter permease [Spirochaetales bacterium]
MVINKLKSRSNFVLFLLPAVLFYFFFAILPLLQGFWLSTTNWDGTAPWTPAQMPIAEFQQKVLDPTTDPGDKALLLKYYVKNPATGMYQRHDLFGLDRYRLLMIFSARGIVNPDFKNVGLKNYVDIFTGNIDPKFFPQNYRQSRFQDGDPLDNIKTISTQEWNQNLLPHVTKPEELKFLENSFQKTPKGYVLNTQLYPMSSTDLQTALTTIPALSNDWEQLYENLTDAGSQLKPVSAVEAILAADPVVAAHRLSAPELSKLKSLAVQVFNEAYLKSVVASNWFVSKIRMGVLVFTIFLTFFNVLFVNILALLLAFALDTQIKSRNILRSMFFIPNVLSLIIVAFIWQLIFTQMLPKLTGYSDWIMNPDIAPWLVVIVATWQGVGYYTIIYLAGLQNVPQDLLEVASIDGANNFQKFMKITLPMLLPAITICLFLSTAGALKTFDIIFALYPSNSTAVGVDNVVVNIFYDAFRDKHAGAATAKAVLLMAVILLISAVQITLTKRKEVEL